MNDQLFIFILAGGSGERFWPMSRKETPKHLLRLLSEQTLLEETANRFANLVPKERLFVLTNHAQIEGCRKALPSLPPEQFIAEPAKRDTAPATALATGIARSRNPDAVCALFPADAAIGDLSTFENNVRDAAAAAASSGALVTFGIPPSFPSTGFGYLKLGDSLEDGPHGSAVRKVLQFVEKPDLEKAEAYVADGNYLWNAGIFFWKAETFLAECRRSAPELAPFIESFPQGDPAPYLADTFEKLPKISVDFAIMEKAEQVLAVPAGFSWDDVGTWTALPAHFGKDDDGNTRKGPVAPVLSKNNIAISNGRLIALCGVEDLVVVETPDAILVCHRDAVQSIKEIQPHLPENLR